MKILMMLVVFFSPSISMAAGLSCRIVNGPEEYLVEARLSEPSGYAAFFDNDSWAYLRPMAISSLECTSCPTNYGFESEDRAVEVRFSVSPLQFTTEGTIAYREGNRKKTKKLRCKLVDELVSESEEAR